MDSSSDEEEVEVNPVLVWRALGTDWARNRHKEKVKLVRVVYQPGHKLAGGGSKGGGRRKKAKKTKKNPRPGEITRWCVPHCVYHAYLPPACVEELYLETSPELIKLPDGVAQWNLVDRTQGLNFYMTTLLPMQQKDLAGATKSRLFFAYFAGKKRLTKFNTSQYALFKEVADAKPNEAEPLVFFEMSWQIITPFYFVVTVSLVYDQATALAKKAPKGKGSKGGAKGKKAAKDVDYSATIDEVTKKACRTLKLVRNNSDATSKMHSCLLGQPKKKKAKKGAVETTLHPYALSTVDSTAVQPLRPGNVQVTQRPFSGKNALPFRLANGDLVAGAPQVPVDAS